MLVHVEGVVQIQQEPDWRNPRRLRAIACADVVVSLLVELIERTEGWDHTAIIVTGDHGMTETHSQVRPNVWLAAAGLRPQKLEDGDWSATFRALGGCAFLHVQDPAEDNVAAVRRVLEKLSPGVRRTFRIVERAELHALGSDPDAPFALAAAPGYVIDQRPDPPDVQPNQGMSHGHHPGMADMNTGFVAAGAGIRAGAAAPLLRLTGLAPLVTALLDVELDTPDGHLHVGLLQD
jgi:hypothetical protein